MRSISMIAFAILISILSISVLAQDPPDATELAQAECRRQFNEVDDGTGFMDRCCPKWRVATCVVNTITSLLRKTALQSEKMRMKERGCEKYSEVIGGSMPYACYIKYRLWVVITLAVVVLLVVVVPVAACICSRKRKSSRAMRA